MRFDGSHIQNERDLSVDVIGTRSPFPFFP